MFDIAHAIPGADNIAKTRKSTKQRADLVHRAMRAVTSLFVTRYHVSARFASHFVVDQEFLTEIVSDEGLSRMYNGLRFHEELRL